MKKILLFLGLILFASCTNNALDDNNYTTYLTCEQLLDVTALNLYPFVSFTDEEMKTLNYSVKLERRQIPADILQGMTTKALFYQFVCCDLSRGMYTYNSAQAGFRAVVEQLNMLPELLNRTDAGNVLLGLLQQIKLSEIDEQDCFHLCESLHRIIAQMEVINTMTGNDIKNYISLMMQHQETIKALAKTTDKWSYPESCGAILFGLGNVMIKYEYQPFIHLFETNQGINAFMCGDNLRNEEIVSLINDCTTRFY
jgi:hypothetical protein